MKPEAEILATIDSARSAGVRVTVKYSNSCAVASVKIDHPGFPGRYIDPWQATDMLKTFIANA